MNYTEISLDALVKPRCQNQCINIFLCSDSKVQYWVNYFRKYVSYIPDFTYDLFFESEAFLEHCSHATEPDVENCYGICSYNSLSKVIDSLSYKTYTLIFDGDTDPKAVAEYLESNFSALSKTPPVDVLCLI